jgi:hypothetical protein
MANARAAGSSLTHQALRRNRPVVIVIADPGGPVDFAQNPPLGLAGCRSPHPPSEPSVGHSLRRNQWVSEHLSQKGFRAPILSALFHPVERHRPVQAQRHVW